MTMFTSKLWSFNDFFKHHKYLLKETKNEWKIWQLTDLFPVEFELFVIQDVSVRATKDLEFLTLSLHGTKVYVASCFLTRSDRLTDWVKRNCELKTEKENYCCFTQLSSDRFLSKSCSAKLCFHFYWPAPGICKDSTSRWGGRQKLPWLTRSLTIQASAVEAEVVAEHLRKKNFIRLQHPEIIMLRLR